MSGLSDDDVARLGRLVEWPEIPGDRYRIERRLGRGGMGTVFLAHDVALERPVAIKVLNPTRGAGELAQRLAREARTIAKLDHASVVPIHEIGALDDGRPYYVMKYVAGRTLREWRARAPARQEALRLFLRTCEAVAHAHALDLIHRDLKPDNVMVGAHGELYVMDWGLAKALGSPAREEARGAAPREDGLETGHGVALGTPGYMAPEQEGAAGASLGTPSDVFALGGILGFLWSGADPRPGQALELADAPPALRSILAKCRAGGPLERYPSAQELAADVARFLDREAVSAHRESWPERIGRFLDRNRFVVWLVAAYLVLRVLVFAFTSG